MNQLNLTVLNWRWWVVLPALLCIFLPIMILLFVCTVIYMTFRVISKLFEGASCWIESRVHPAVKSLKDWVQGA